MKLMKAGLGITLSSILLFLIVHSFPSPKSECQRPLQMVHTAVHTISPDTERMEAGLAAIEEKPVILDREGLKPFDKPMEAAEFYLKQRLPAGQKNIPMEHLRAELQKIEAREAEQRSSSGRSRNPGGIQGWESIGPGNIGGRTRAIVIDPVDPEIMYAAGVAGGIWKSLNGGASWDVADDLMLNLAVCALAIDPANPNILYAGTGEGVYPHDVYVQGLGIFKSADAGATWTQLAGTLNGVPEGAFYYVNKIVISPNDPNRVYAATGFGVWRSLDGGQTWSVILSNPWEISTPPTTNGCYLGCTDLAVRSDSNPDVLFAAFGSLVQDGLYRSEDGGDTWLAYNAGSSQGRMTIAIAPSNNNIIYLLMADNGSSGPFGKLVNVYCSTDGGDTSFQPRVNMSSLTGPWLLSSLADATGCTGSGGTRHQGWYDNIIAVDPLDPDIVWVGGVDIFRSDDGGRNFWIAGYWFYYQEMFPPPYQIHLDHHVFLFHPDFNGTTNQTLYAGNDGGIFRTENALAATSVEDCPFPGDDPLPEIIWESMNNGYGVTQFYHGDSARADDVFVGGSQDNGTSRVVSRDTPDEWVMISGGDGGYVAIDPTDALTMYVESQGFPNIWKSTDGGDNFTLAVNGITDTDGLFIAPFAMDPSDPDILWTGGSRPWRTTNGAASWGLAGSDFNGPSRISAIAVAPSDSSIVYLGFDNGYVVRTLNALDPSPSWSIFTNGLQDGWISSVAVDPVDPNIAYCTYSNFGLTHNVFRTLNGGSSWASIDGIGMTGVPDIPVHWIAVRPTNSQQLYAGTELGVFVSEDGGIIWEPGNDGLAHTVVESLDFKDNNTLVAFTHGRGAYITSLKEVIKIPPGTQLDEAPDSETQAEELWRDGPG